MKTPDTLIQNLCYNCSNTKEQTMTTMTTMLLTSLAVSSVAYFLALKNKAMKTRAEHVSALLGALVPGSNILILIVEL